MPKPGGSTRGPHWQETGETERDNDPPLSETEKFDVDPPTRVCSLLFACLIICPPFGLTPFALGNVVSVWQLNDDSMLLFDVR